MTKGVPKSGRRDLHKRWTLELLMPLHRRYISGEGLQTIAEEVHCRRGSLRSAMIAFGLEMPIIRKGGFRPRRNRSTSDYDSNHVVSESWKRQSFDASAHRSARHYKGTFEL